MFLMSAYDSYVDRSLSISPEGSTGAEENRKSYKEAVKQALRTADGSLFLHRGSRTREHCEERSCGFKVPVVKPFVSPAAR